MTTRTLAVLKMAQAVHISKNLMFLPKSKIKTATAHWRENKDQCQRVAQRTETPTHFFIALSLSAAKLGPKKDI